VTAELESAVVTSLPPGVRLSPGKIEITFSADNTIAACERLHALSKTMEHDCFDSAPLSLLGLSNPKPRNV